MTPEVRKVLAALDSGEALVTDPVELVHCRINDRPVTFCLDRVHDPIQRHHRRGSFYEARELERLRAFVRPGAVIIDVGANIGNHAMFFAMELEAARVIPIEPNPVAYRLLVSNVVLNRLRGVIDLNFLGVGLSDLRGDDFGIENRDRNIGAARMLPGEGSVQAYPGDALFECIVPDLIKIDVEGMEMKALAGLERTIAANRPVLFVEVDTGNDEAFLQWAEARHYAVSHRWQRYKTNKNYLLTPTR